MQLVHEIGVPELVFSDYWSYLWLFFIMSMEEFKGIQNESASLDLDMIG